MTGIATVLFDLDGTLCEHAQDPGAVLARAFDRAGVEQFCTIEDVDAVLDDVPAADTDVEFYDLSLRAAAERCGVAVDEADTRAVARAYDELVDHSRVEFAPGAADALAAAREVGPLGLVTNGGEANQTLKLEALGIADAFDATVFCDPAAGIDPKPDPTMFELALSELGADPAETLYVGDSLHADVRGASQLGMRTAWVRNGRERDAPSDPDPTYELGTVGELADVL